MLEVDGGICGCEGPPPPPPGVYHALVAFTFAFAVVAVVAGAGKNGDGERDAASVNGYSVHGDGDAGESGHATWKEWVELVRMEGRASQ